MRECAFETQMAGSSNWAYKTQTRSLTSRCQSVCSHSVYLSVCLSPPPIICTFDLCTVMDVRYGHHNEEEEEEEVNFYQRCLCLAELSSFFSLSRFVSSLSFCFCFVLLSLLNTPVVT